MKIPALLTLLLAALLAALPTRRASAQDTSFDVFYNSLADDGDWYNTPDFGYVWHPAIADGNEKWRPYTDGYWAQTDDGWAWVSYESFGWATYHYGRWTRLQSIGWAWVPGYQWGPGWVSWRTSDQYVGWAPLPPRVEHTGAVVSVDYNSVEAVDDGYTAAVDQDYDIGPDNYCFVDVRQFGAPVLSEVLLPFPRNVFFIGNTTNVTNIYYRRNAERTVVYNSGPDFAFVSGHVERPIQRLRIDRREDVAYLRENGHGGNPTIVKNGVLQVAAPLIARRAVNFEQVKPARVKLTIAQPQIVHGWSNAGGDPVQVQQLHERIKTQAQAAPRQARADLPPQGVAPVIEAPQARERTVTETDRTVRRDANQHVKDAREQTRAPAEAVTAPAAAEAAPNKGQPTTSQERVARKQAQQTHEQPAAQAVQTPASARVQNAPHPAATLSPEEDRIVHSPARPAREQGTAPAAERSAPNSRDARQEVRATPQPHSSQVPPNGEQGDRDQRRTDRQQPTREPRESQQTQQTPSSQAPRRNERQAAPAPAPGNPQNGDDKKKQPNN